jgi:GcrA cell cycle regulator
MPEQIIKWTDENVARLKSLWGEQHTAREVAATMGITRSAVLAKVRRLGLCFSRPAALRTPKAPRSRRHRKPRAKANLKVFDGPTTSFSTAPIIQGDHLAHIEAPIGPRVSILELNEFTCRWPIGDGREVTYCGALPKLKKSYCPYHYGIAHESARSQISREAAEKRWEKRGKRVNTA